MTSSAYSDTLDISNHHGSFLITRSEAKQMAKSKAVKTKPKTEKANNSGLLSVVGSGLVKLTAPIKNSGLWKKLRKTVLRSPFGGYFVDSWRELRRVDWPNRRTAWRLTLTVVLFSVIFAVFTTALDFGFEKLAKQVFLK